MAAGLVGHMGYDMIRHIESLPDTNPDTLDIPDSCFIRPRVMVIFDAVTDSMYIITPSWSDDEQPANNAYAAACQLIENTLERLHAPIAPPQAHNEAALSEKDFVSNIDKPTYASMVDKAKEHILAGDIFQVVLSQRFSAPFTLPPFCIISRVAPPQPLAPSCSICNCRIIHW